MTAVATVKVAVSVYRATAKHTAYCCRDSVCMSVCLSNACIVTKRKHLAKRSSIMTNRKSTTKFPMSLRWTAYVAHNSANGASKATFFVFSNKVCYKVSLCENFQLQSCKAFTGLSNHVQMVGGGRPRLPGILGKSDPPPSKTATFNRYSLVARQP